MVQDRLAATTSVTLDLDKERAEYNYYWSLTPELVLLVVNERLACAVLGTAIPKLKAKAQAIEQELNRKKIKIDHDIRLLDRCAQIYPWRIGGWLRASINQGYISCVQLLLDSGADPNYGYASSEFQLSLSTEPPLQTAWRRRRVEIAELLIRRGANCFLIPITFNFDLTLGHYTSAMPEQNVQNQPSQPSNQRESEEATFELVIDHKTMTQITNSSEAAKAKRAQNALERALENTYLDPQAEDSSTTKEKGKAKETS
ncbi:hypothetical protein FQN50_004375 [Emmonsiellopsis sp. PD_5]|nr:hypothetical protein FQN50_004375 [Emmonsiellopsis sp. PD_5]